MPDQGPGLPAAEGYYEQQSVERAAPLCGRRWRKGALVVRCVRQATHPNGGWTHPNGGWVRVQEGSSELKRLLEADKLGALPPVKGTQEFGAGPPENEPVSLPVIKHTAHLQVRSPLCPSTA